MAKSLALGTVLRVEDDSDFVAVGHLTSIGVPGPTKPEIDVTDFDSVAAEFLPGLPDFGTLEFSGFYNAEDTGQSLLFADAQDPDAPVRSFQIDFERQNVRFEFDAYVASFQPTAGGVGEAYTFEGSLRVTGAVTQTTIP